MPAQNVIFSELLPWYQTSTLVIMFTKWPLITDLKRNVEVATRTQTPLRQWTIEANDTMIVVCIQDQFDQPGRMAFAMFITRTSTSGKNRVFVYHRLILSTTYVGAMLWSMAHLRRIQLRMVVCVVGCCW